MNGFFALAAALGGTASPSPSVSIPASTAKIGTTASLTTNSITSIVSNGALPITYAWSQLTGGAFTINTPTASSTSFTATGLSAAGETRSGVFQLIVTDSLGRTASATINVSAQRYASLLVSASPSTIAQVTDLASITSSQSSAASISGGSGSYGVAWVKASGDAITAVTPNALSTAFRAASMAAGESRTAVFFASATDGVSGQTANSGNVTVTLTRPGALSASLSPPSLSDSGNTATVTTSGSATATGVGGSGNSANYAYLWTKVSGAAITAVSASSASTPFRATTLAVGESRTAAFQCQITDNITGQTAVTGTITVTISRYAALSASVSPGSVNGSGSSSTVASSAATITASGGSSSFTYAWVKASGGAIVAVHPTSASTTFQASGLATGETRTAVFTGTVTDTVTGSTATVSCSVTISSIASAATYSPAAGSYSVDDGGSGTATFSIAASAPVVWTWSVSGRVGSTVATGDTASSITFTLTAGLTDRSSIVTINSNGKTWTVTLSATGDPSSG